MNEDQVASWFDDEDGSADTLDMRRDAHSDLAHDEMKDDRVLHERFDLHGFPRTREDS